MEYLYPYNNQSSHSSFGIGIIFFIFGVFLTFFILYLIYEFYLKNKNENVKEILEIQPDIEVLKLPENDLNIDDTVDGSCIQKRRIYDSDFDRTTYPINDNEIIYF